MADVSFPITGNADADRLLVDDPFALLLGMLLDQQVTMESAFAAPHRLADRLGDRFSPGAIAAMPAEELEEAFREKPALHRFPGSMAKRAHQLCTHLVEHHGGDAAALWSGVDDGRELLARVKALPGFGDEKAKIFVALLAKRFAITPSGWEEAAAPFSDDERRSAADVSSPETLAEVRAWKKAMKAKGKGKQD
ncbi:MAG: HhH-GPD-type base excision DNA repair protein [Actinomycetota bacterium]|nr:HhH-GPD-type base excision DNA repair protein [Actinomycetota bacterium]